MIYVIGSGPTGVSCAVALTRAGHPVTLLDVGLGLEPERRTKLTRTASQPSAEWSETTLSQFKEKMQSRASGIPLKYTYGSDFPYRVPELVSSIQTTGVALLPSMAQGGLSNVWGAAILPYVEQDIDDWPITVADLAPHYQSVLSFMPLAGKPDHLAERFPLHTNSPHELPLSRQARDLLSNLESQRSELLNEGIIFGRSRLAVAARNENGFACAACGLCMYGCPYELIYKSSSTLEMLQRNDLFKYKSGIIVNELTESGDAVVIKATDLVSGAPIQLQGSRVFVAAGVIPTTRLILNSLKAFNVEVTLKDSQYFLLPLLRLHGSGLVKTEELHTLSQLFIEIFDAQISKRSIHLQLYTYNELFREAFASSLGVAHSLFRPFENSVLARFLLIQGYLHSDISSRVSVRLERDSTRQDGGTLIMSSRKNNETRPTLSRLIAKLRSNARRLGALPLSPLLKIGEAGRGFHSGGTLPMVVNPGELQTDIYGRPQGMKRIHVADATTFPSIPASTITLTAMANAYRIASTFSNE